MLHKLVIDRKEQYELNNTQVEAIIPFTYKCIECTTENLTVYHSIEEYLPEIRALIGVKS